MCTYQPVLVDSSSSVGCNVLSYYSNGMVYKSCIHFTGVHNNVEATCSSGKCTLHMYSNGTSIIILTCVSAVMVSHTQAILQILSI